MRIGGVPVTFLRAGAESRQSLNFPSVRRGIFLSVADSESAQSPPGLRPVLAEVDVLFDARPPWSSIVLC